MVLMFMDQLMKNYANNAMKIYYGFLSNVYNGFSFAASYTPNYSRIRSF